MNAGRGPREIVVLPAPVCNALILIARGFGIVFLTAANVYQITHEHWVGMFMFGWLISYIWWGNARTSNRSEVPYARYYYALGAGLGTLAGVAAMKWLAT